MRALGIDVSVRRGLDLVLLDGTPEPVAIRSVVNAAFYDLQLQLDCRRTHARADEYGAPRVDIGAELVSLLQ